ncbi:hypothetical protein PDE_03933 [Penicillium oxalicum 114-2]|uniref:Secreted protein n=1 Tax=Penicillium oxalicum (strain 114-2 / CGMCC 5302) TaxID=933388 RepID=S8B3C1_PENO1|nr:hypothetical protein PDE_03933 [Penicillium oxalicum 114-2]
MGQRAILACLVYPVSSCGYAVWVGTISELQKQQEEEEEEVVVVDLTPSGWREGGGQLDWSTGHWYAVGCPRGWKAGQNR